MNVSFFNRRTGTNSPALTFQLLKPVSSYIFVFQLKFHLIFFTILQYFTKITGGKIKTFQCMYEKICKIQKYLKKIVKKPFFI